MDAAVLDALARDVEEAMRAILQLRRLRLERALDDLEVSVAQMQVLGRDIATAPARFPAAARQRLEFLRQRAVLHPEIDRAWRLAEEFGDVLEKQQCLDALFGRGKRFHTAAD